MFQTPDYTILDHLAEICEVVDFNFRYLYVNDAAAEHEQTPKDEMLGQTILELHPNIETTPIFSRLKECMNERKSIEFEDKLSKRKIKIEPVPEGALIHSIGLPAHKTKVKINRKTVPAIINNGYLQRSIRDQSKVLEIEGWLDALDLRTKETNEHILRVTDATVALAKMAGVPDSEIVHIRRGALLHDIGKTGIPDTILLKSDTLTAEEWEVIRKHPVYAYDLFYPIEYLRSCLPIPYSHHEKWDGTGYPQGLKGEQIPLSARLFAVIDVWDRLSSDCVYRKAWPHEKIMEYIQEQSGFHFDPQVVDLFFQANKNPAKFGLR